jgi:hypothetical protein
MSTPLGGRTNVRHAWIVRDDPLETDKPEVPGAGPAIAAILAVLLVIGVLARKARQKR